MTAAASAAAAAFDLPGAVDAVEPHPTGHINEGYLVVAGARRYLLQRLNPSVFHDPDAVMTNVVTVTDHLRAKGEPTLTLVSTRDGSSSWQATDGAVWRMYEYIQDVEPLEVGSPAAAAVVGRAYGRFHRLLADLDPGSLRVSLPGFHDPGRRMAQLEAAVEVDRYDRLGGACRLVDALRTLRHAIAADSALAGLPVRVAHNDAKAANLLVDDAGGHQPVVVDLDTVMPGSVLWDVGFQLSLLATAGLIAFGAPIEGRLRRWPAWLREPVALTLAAQLTTLPVILATFERVSLVAPLANVVVVPLVPLVMLASAVAAAAGILASVVQVPVVTDAVNWFAGGSAWLGLRLMIMAGTGAAALPLAAMPVAAPGWLAVAWYPGLVLLWRRANRPTPDKAPGDSIALLTVLPKPTPLRAAVRRLATLAGASVAAIARPRRAPLAMTAVLAATTLATLPDGRLHLVVLDVGQGDGILAVTPTGRSMLIDSGPDPDQTLRQLGAALPWWRRAIDVVILTHPHQDHVGGFPEVLRRFRVATILDPGKPYANPTYDRFLQLSLAERGASYRFARAGQRLSLDASSTFEIWYPNAADAAGPLPSADINNASVVGLLTVGRFSALLTGDAKTPVEDLLASRSLLRPIDILKVGHHGSSSGTSPQFLAALHPAAGLISVGAGNRYGHPHLVTIRALQNARATVLRTDRDGSIQVETDGASWTISTHGRVIQRGVARGAEAARAGTASQTPRAPTGSIPSWPFRTRRRRLASSPRAGSLTASLPIRRAWRGSRLWRRGGWKPPGSRSTWASSRPPPSSTISTSSRRATAEGSTAWWVRGSSNRWGSLSWHPPLPAIR